jgi:hypothetical protein
MLYGTSPPFGAGEIMRSFIPLLANWHVQHGSVLIGATKPGHHLIGCGGIRFGGAVKPLGGDQAVGAAPTDAVRYGCVRCHFSVIGDNK